MSTTNITSNSSVAGTPTVNPFSPISPSSSSVVSSSTSSNSLTTITSTYISSTVVVPVLSEQSFTANSTVPGKTYSNATQKATASATSTGLIPLAFISFIEKPDTGLSKGPVAGIAIGTLLLGAVIAAAVMFAVQRKKQRRRKSKPARLSAYATSGEEHASPNVLAVLTNEKSLATTNTTDPDYLLPQPEDDQSMASTAKRLFVHIGDHVENFYHNNSLRDNATPQSEEDELLMNRKTRHAAIKRYICREMLTATGWSCDPSYSLLPAQMVSMAQQMSRGNLSENTYEVAWSRWRVSVGLLLKAQDQNQKRQAREYWVGRMQAKLQPFQIDSPDMRGQVHRDLHAICELAERLALLICSQPARWEFDWSRSDGQKDFVIFPAFGRSTDNKARRLDRPNRVVDAHRLQ